MDDDLTSTFKQDFLIIREYMILFGLNDVM